MIHVYIMAEFILKVKLVTSTVLLYVYIVCYLVYDHKANECQNSKDPNRDQILSDYSRNHMTHDKTKLVSWLNSNLVILISVRVNEIKFHPKKGPESMPSVKVGIFNNSDK